MRLTVTPWELAGLAWMCMGYTLQNKIDWSASEFGNVLIPIHGNLIIMIESYDKCIWSFTATYVTMYTALSDSHNVQCSLLALLSASLNSASSHHSYAVTMVME